MTLTFTYGPDNKPIAGIKIIMTESDGTVTVLTTDSNGQVTLPTTTNTYTLDASLAEIGSDPVTTLDAVYILQHVVGLRTLDADQIQAADIDGDGKITTLDAVKALQHSVDLITINQGLVFLDANTGEALSETTFNPGDTPSISVIRLGDADLSFDPTTITDHAPILTGKTTLTMDENETTVGTLLGTDADGDTLTYSITGGADKDLFTINASTGVLSFIAGPDYEDPGDSGGDNLYDVEITVSDGTNTNAQALIISVLDLNEKLGLTNKVINENETGATVGDLSINDTEFGNTNITYALSGDDAQYFSLDGATIKLNSDVSADFETKSKYTLTVTATNAAGETITEKVVVKIANVNEAVNLTTALTDQSNNEDAAFSFTVPSNTFNDEDGDTLTYTATLEDGSALPSWLSFDAATQTFSGTPLNDDVGVISVTVTASDGSFSVSDTFALTVVNTNDDPTALTLSSDAINENTSGAVVGDLTTTDVDVGDAHTYSLSGDDASLFEVVNGQLKLKAGISANYETKSTYAVTVTTTDGSGSTFAQSFSINVNTAPTSMTLSNLTVDESNYGLTIGSFTTSDPNSNDSFTYSIVGGSNSSYFEINTLGELKLKDTSYADYEVDDTLTVTIRTTDQGGLSYDQTFNISVNNLNYATPEAAEIRPVWNVPLSSDVSINPLIWGFSYDLNRNTDEPIIITYSLIKNTSVFVSNYGDYRSSLGDNFEDRIVTGSSEWEALVDQAFDYWGQVSGIIFIKIEETSTQCGDIRIGLQSSWGSSSGAAGFSMTTASSVYGSAAGDIWCLSRYDPVTNDSNGTGAASLILHEIGHSLGLAHPHGGGGYSTTTTINTWSGWSVMGYSGDIWLNEDWDVDGDGVNDFVRNERLASVAPGINDIKAIQYIYGMTPNFNQGDTEYVFEGPIYESIYDTGGTDTINLSSYSLDIILDLTPGTVSTIGNSVARMSIFDASNWEWDDRIDTGFNISISQNTVIENAMTGSGNDTIYCNVAVNTINCGLGDDSVYLINLGDMIYGSGGDDWFKISNNSFSLIDGGEGDDYLAYAGSTLNLSDFTDTQITGIENIDIQFNSPTLLTITKQSILDLDGEIFYDLDGDGDDDYVTWVSGDILQDNILLDAENWSRDTNAASPYPYYYYTNDNGDTYLAATWFVGVYVKLGMVSSQLPIKVQLKILLMLPLEFSQKMV